MSESLFALVILLALFAAGVVAQRQIYQSPRREASAQEKADEDRDYAEIAGLMSRREFHAIREKNRREREEFGNGSLAPYWPSHEHNGSYTLRRGVWVDDSAPRQPTNRELDAAREAYRQKYELIEFTLVEGEQDAPLGKDGAMVRVIAEAGRPSEVRDANGNLVSTWPCVSYRPVDPNVETGTFWSSSASGTLPLKMSIRVEKSKRVAAIPPSEAQP